MKSSGEGKVMIVKYFHPIITGGVGGMGVSVWGSLFLERELVWSTDDTSEYWRVSLRVSYHHHHQFDTYQPKLQWNYLLDQKDIWRFRCRCQVMNLARWLDWTVLK